MSAGTIANDLACITCNAKPQRLTCHACGQTAMITDCGHQDQPRPIAPGRIDGTDMHLIFCSFCA